MIIGWGIKKNLSNDPAHVWVTQTNHIPIKTLCGTGRGTTLRWEVRDPETREARCADCARLYEEQKL